MTPALTAALTLLAAACTGIVWLAALLVLTRRSLTSTTLAYDALGDTHDQLLDRHMDTLTRLGVTQGLRTAERGIKEHMVWRAKVYAAALDRCEHLLAPPDDTLTRLGRDARHFIGIAHQTSDGPLPTSTDTVLAAWTADPWTDLTQPPPGPPNPPKPPHHQPVG